MAKEAYMTVAVAGTKKVSVCARRIGTRDRLSVIAVANNEEVAEKIVDALNLQQGKLTELEVPAQRVLTEVREQLSVERDRNRELGLKLRGKEDEIRQFTRDLDVARQANVRLTTERDAAQKTARETA